MTFYLCMTGIHTPPTSGQGKEAAPNPCTIEGCVLRQACRDRNREESLQ